MELHAFHFHFSVAQAHDRAVVGLGGNLKCARQRFALHDQRVVARGRERLIEAKENSFAVMLNLAGFAVHYFWRANHAPAKRCADGLMSQANAKNRNLAREALDTAARSRPPRSACTARAKLRCAQAQAPRFH